MAITIKQLIDNQELKLQLVNDGDVNTLDTGIVWVHPTDVVNAAEYAEPGEILLTCSTNFPLESMSNVNDISLLRRDRRKLGLSSSYRDMEAAYRELWMRYVDSLSRAGVIAIGFGVQMKHPTIPHALLEAVQRAHIVLFEVPVEINFSQIAKVVLHEQSEENENAQRIMYSSQREFFSIAAGNDPIRGIINHIAHLVKGWSAYVDQRMQVVSISNRHMRIRAMKAMQRLAKQRNQNLTDNRAMFCSVADGGQYYVCKIRSDNEEYGIIIVFSPSSGVIGSMARSLCVLAAEALSWSLPRLIDSSQREQQIRSIGIKELAHGDYDVGLSIVGGLCSTVPTAPIQVYCMEFPRSADSRGMDLSINAVGSDGIFYGRYDQRFWIVCGGERDNAVWEWIKWWGVDWGRGSVLNWSDIQEGFDEALRGLRLKNLNKENSIANITPMELVDVELAQIYARALLEPMNDLSSRERLIILDTLRAVMLSSFNVNDAAEILHVHRHTVENRMKRIEQLIGLNFNNQSDRVKLWIAASFIRE